MTSESDKYRQRVEKVITRLIDYLDVDPEDVPRNSFYRRKDMVTYLEGRLNAEDRESRPQRNITTNIAMPIVDDMTVDDRTVDNRVVIPKEPQPQKDDSPHEYVSVEYTANESYVRRIQGVIEALPYEGHQVFLEQDRLIVVLGSKALNADVENFKTSLKRGLRFLKMETLERLFTYESKGNEVYIGIRNERGQDKAFQYLAAFKEVIEKR